MYKKIFKRFFDLIFSLIGLLCLSPILLTISILLYFTNKRAGIFFTQQRPGKNGKIFKVIKFKSMTDEKDHNNKLLPEEMRLTKTGKIIRASSIDELPQLINVLKGDMSLVGPRPLLVEYLPLYSKEHARRHEVRPGITGWAQIHGRNLLKLSNKFEYDIWYVDNVSLMLDIKILFKTISKTLSSGNNSVTTSDILEVDDLNFTKRI